MSDILIKFLTGNPDDDWERTQPHIPAIGSVVTRPDEGHAHQRNINERIYRVMGHVWPSGDRDSYVMLQVNEIAEAIAEPEPETEDENEN